MNGKQIEQQLSKTIKKTVFEKGVTQSTRRGNKELSLLIRRLAKHPFKTPETVIAYGEQIGTAIANLSQQQEKKQLDRGIIHQVSLQFQEIEVLETPLIAKKESKTSSVLEKHESTSRSVEKTKTPEQSPMRKTGKVTKPVAEMVTELEEEEEGESVAEMVTEIEEEEEDVSVAETVAEIEEEEGESVAETVAEIEEEEDVSVAETVAEIEEEEDVSVAETVAEIEEEEDVSVAETVAEIEEEDPSSQISSEDTIPQSLKERINEDIKTAMKARDKIRLETVRSIKKAILEKEISLRPNGQDILTPEQEIDLLSQQAKQRRDSIEQYQKGKREDLADKETQELAIIETYLPKQLSDNEIDTILDKIVVEMGATSAKDMGKVMGQAMKELKGKVDGKKVQTMVKNKLAT